MTRSWQIRLRKLAHRKWRLRYQEAVLEGVRLVDTALDHHVPLSCVWWAPDLLERPGGEDLLQRLREAKVQAVPVSSAELKKVSTVETSQGLIATMDVIAPPLSEGGDLWVVVDGVQDPGNLGTIVRSAAAAGADGIFLLPGTADLYNPKTLRAAMGAAFQVPVHSTHLSEQVLAYLHRQEALIAVAEVAGAVSPSQVDFTTPVAVVVGNEGWGPSRDMKNAADRTVRIPMPGAAESLNVAMAATVLLYEVVRQRLLVC